MMDKPKRKRTPRRRILLLLILLPIVVLIAGFIALKPQMDAWLETDPFTPQCNFESDRWYATGYPAILGSFNTGQYDDFTARSDYVYMPSRWSPDGRYHLHVKDFDTRSMVITTYDGNEVFSISDPQLSYDGWYWSPNSQMILYSTNTQTSSVLQVYQLTDGIFQARNFSDFTSSDFPIHRMANSDIGAVSGVPNSGWSRGGRYILFTQDDRSYVIDVEMDELIPLTINIPYLPLPIWWSDTAFYFLEDQILKSYDVSTHETTDVTDLPNETTVTILVFGDNLVGIVDDSYTIKYYARSQHQWVSTEAELNFVQSLEAIHSIIYYQDADDGTIDYYQLDTQTGESTLLLNTPTPLSQLRFSPSGQYVLYADEATDNTWIIQPITTIEDSLTHTKSLTFEHPTKIKWLAHQGQDWLLVQEHKPHLSEKIYMNYILDPDAFTPCKVGLSDINFWIQPEMES